jgi:hypothetical protein
MSNLMVGQWAGKVGDIVYAKVMGSGEFPIDMLRYDNCAPATEEDSSIIRGTIIHCTASPHNWVIMIKKVLREHIKPGDRVFNIDRWNSFGCAIDETGNIRLNRTPVTELVTSSNAANYSRYQRQYHA